MTDLALGSTAPEFGLRDQHGHLHRLSELSADRNVVLVFFPFAFTSVCTSELEALRDDLSALQNATAQVLAVSCDPIPSLRAFADRERLGFPLLSDFWPHGEVASAYGAFDELTGTAARVSYVIDRRRLVRWSVRTDIATPRDVRDYEKALAEL